MVSLSPLRRKLTTESASKTPWLIVFMLWLGTLLVALDVSIIGAYIRKNRKQTIAKVERCCSPQNFHAIPCPP